MKKTKLQAYLDFIAKLHSLNHDVKKPGKNVKTKSSNGKIRVILLFLLTFSTSAIALRFDLARIADSRYNSALPGTTYPETAAAFPASANYRIQLLSFSATLHDNKVDVEWRIQKDIQNATFTIERSVDAENYYSIGWVASRGNTDQEQFYLFRDTLPVNGISYYRLVQSDINGQVKTYPPTVVNNRAVGAVSIYPNPASSGRVYLTGIANPSGYKVTVRDITGKIVPSAFGVFENDSVELIIDETVTAKKGIFIITIDDGKRIFQQKLIIR
jgi:hypothetical protein